MSRSRKSKESRHYHIAQDYPWAKEAFSVLEDFLILADLPQRLQKLSKQVPDRELYDYAKSLGLDPYGDPDQSITAADDWIDEQCDKLRQSWGSLQKILTYLTQSFRWADFDKVIIPFFFKQVHILGDMVVACEADYRGPLVSYKKEFLRRYPEFNELPTVLGDQPGFVLGKVIRRKGQQFIADYYPIDTVMEHTVMLARGLASLEQTY